MSVCSKPKPDLMRNWRRVGVFHVLENEAAPLISNSQRASLPPARRDGPPLSHAKPQRRAFHFGGRTPSTMDYGERIETWVIGVASIVCVFLLLFVCLTQADLINSVLEQTLRGGSNDH